MFTTESAMIVKKDLIFTISPCFKCTLCEPQTKQVGVILPLGQSHAEKIYYINNAVLGDQY